MQLNFLMQISFQESYNWQSSQFDIDLSVCCIKIRSDGIIDNSGGRGRNKILKSMMLVHQVPDATGDSAGLAQIQLKCCKMWLEL